MFEDVLFCTSSFETRSWFLKGFALLLGVKECKFAKCGADGLMSKIIIHTFDKSQLLYRKKLHFYAKNDIIRFEV